MNSVLVIINSIMNSLNCFLFLIDFCDNSPITPNPNLKFLLSFLLKLDPPEPRRNDKIGEVVRECKQA